MYDSRPDTYAHKINVAKKLQQIANELQLRGLEHDDSKLVEPEVDIFNEYTERLKDLEYGSEEYKENLKEMQVAVQHHYSVNGHHPEYHLRGIDGMTLIDLIEMLSDWKASNERYQGKPFAESLEINRVRFEIGDQLFGILVYTSVDLGFITVEEGGDLMKEINA